MFKNYPNELSIIKTLAGVDFLDVCLLGETRTGKTNLARHSRKIALYNHHTIISINPIP